MADEIKQVEREYVSFTITPYCLPTLLLAMDNNGIKSFAITQSDNDLMVRIPKNHLENIVYPHMRGKVNTACACKE